MSRYECGYTVDAKQIEALNDALAKYKDKSEKVINEVLHDEAGQMIIEGIMPLLPVSGRKWKGKKAAASSTQPFLIDKEENLKVTVKTKSAYHYLYFPDDGSNTSRHAGNQHFMQRGGDSKVEEIIDRCISRLTEF